LTLEGPEGLACPSISIVVYPCSSFGTAEPVPQPLTDTVHARVVDVVVEARVQAIPLEHQGIPHLQLYKEQLSRVMSAPSRRPCTALLGRRVRICYARNVVAQTFAAY
jgi:hypothetical protein